LGDWGYGIVNRGICKKVFKNAPKNKEVANSINNE
jgi:hypothetical protein